MHRRPPRVLGLAAVACLVFGLGCADLLALSVGAPSIGPALLQRDFADALVVDVRSAEEFEQGHIPRSVHVPPDQIHGFFHAARQRGDRAVVLVCRSAKRAALALPSARYEGFSRTFVLEGGMVRWEAEGLPVARGPAPPDDVPRAAPSRALSSVQQGVAFLSGGVVKPTYMLLALVVAWVLRRSKTADLRLLFHGALWFFVGEAFCAVNFYVPQSGFVQPIDLLHSLGMVVMSALVPWGLYRLVDDRIFHFSEPQARCVGQRLCGRCWKRDAPRCGPHDVMLLLVAAAAGLSLMPLSAELRPSQLATSVLGNPVDYGMPIVNHLIELRAFPCLGAGVFALAFVLLLGGARSVRRAEPFVFVGLGFLGYSTLRHLLIGVYRDELWWADFWEESTELLMIAALGLLLIVFRRQLGLVRTPEGAAAPAPLAPASPGESSPLPPSP